MTDLKQPVERPSKKDEAIKQAVREAAKHIGATMKNGGIILATVRINGHEWADEYLVLALLPNNTATPFAVWTRFIGVGQNADGRTFHTLDYCVRGDYHRGLGDALAAYTDEVVAAGS